MFLEILETIHQFSRAIRAKDGETISEAPPLTAQMMKVFEVKDPEAFSIDAWDVKYTYNRGPAIGEGLFVFTPK